MKDWSLPSIPSTTGASSPPTSPRPTPPAPPRSAPPGRTSSPPPPHSAAAAASPASSASADRRPRGAAGSGWACSWRWRSTCSPWATTPIRHPTSPAGPAPRFCQHGPHVPRVPRWRQRRRTGTGTSCWQRWARRRASTTTRAARRHATSCPRTRATPGYGTISGALPVASHAAALPCSPQPPARPSRRRPRSARHTPCLGRGTLNFGRRVPPVYGACRSWSSPPAESPKRASGQVHGAAAAGGLLPPRRRPRHVLPRRRHVTPHPPPRVLRAARLLMFCARRVGGLVRTLFCARRGGGERLTARAALG